MFRERVKHVLQTPFGSRLLAAADRMAATRAIIRRASYPRVPFDNFADAWRAAASDRHAGHDTESIAIHRELSQKLRPSDPPVLRILTQIASSGSLRVLDFGGNIGNLYYSYLPHLPGNVDIQWHVLDLPAVTSAGREIANQRSARGLRFFESLESIGAGYDVVLASGALHYWEQDVGAWIEKLPHSAGHIIVNRSPIHPGRSFVTIQQTDTYAVPCIVRRRADLIEAFSKHGLRLSDEWLCPELSLTLALYPQLSVTNYSGFYFQKEH